MYSRRCVRCRCDFESDYEYAFYCPECNAKEKVERAVQEARTIERGLESGWFCAESKIYCPHCGHVMEVDDDCELYEEGDHERQCGFCEKEFTINTSISITYSTEKLDEEDTENEEQEQGGQANSMCDSGTVGAAISGREREFVGNVD